MSFFYIGKILRTTMTAALPSGTFSQVVYDALDIAALPASVRAASITYEMGEPQLMSFGKQRVQIVGTGFIRLYEPTDKGDGDQTKIADEIAEVLTHQSALDDRVRLDYGLAGLSNTNRTGAHWERVLRIPFKASYYLN